jgi:hypothetical protein
MENARLVEEVNREAGKELIGLNVLADLTNVEY